MRKQTDSGGMNYMDNDATAETVHDLEVMVASLTELLDVQEKVVGEQSERLKENEARFMAIYDGSNDAIMLLTENGFFDCNPSSLKIFGIKGSVETLKTH